VQLIDALRGFALFGIIVVNVGFFASTWAGISDPDFDGVASDLTRTLVTFIFESKFYLLFSFLFGYSFTIQMDSAARRGLPFGRIFGRRMSGLFLLGLIHGVLFFSGDILVLYSITGCVLFLARNWKPKTALLVAGGLLVAGSLIWAIVAFAAIEDPEPFRSDQVELAEQARELEAGYSSREVAQVVDTRSDEFAEIFFILLLIQGPGTLAMFLVGLAAGRAKVLHEPGRFQTLWRRLLLAGLLLGLPAAAFYAWAGMDPTESHPALEPAALGVNVLLAPLLSAAYMSAIILIRDSKAGRRLVSALAPAGRIALSNYLFQSIALSVIFTGYGFGLVGQVSPAVAVAVAIAVFAVQVRLSALWLRNHRYGPAEWILRALTNWSWPAGGTKSP
jgi:uncharacterized protein